MNCLHTFYSPQLDIIHRGKVRDSIRVDDNTRMIVVSDRISAFNKNSNSLIPHKGAVLNGITNFWFAKTKDIIGNHLIKQVDPNISLVREAKAIKVEMIVRAYLCGSLLRGYNEGKRLFSGVRVPDGMTKNQAFPKPILTPTTKDEYDTEISEKEIIEKGLATQEVYDKMKKAAFALFDFGSDLLAKQGIILVDTKYEFGIIDNELVLIDEIHTPDSSRFWLKSDYDKNPVNATQIDKEFVRQWLLKNEKNGHVPDELSEEVIQETSNKYKEIYTLITGNSFVSDNLDIKTRMYNNLVEEGLIKNGFIALVMGSKSDLKHAEKIVSYFDDYPISYQMRIISAHKNGENILGLAETLNESIEPVAVIAIAGRSNGLGGALASNLSVPVINCPPFADKTDLMLNINSSLIMPSAAPAMTVIHPDNAAHAALRSLNNQEIRKKLTEEIKKMKQKLTDSDMEVSERYS